MDFTIEHSGAVGVLTLGGELTVPYAGELKAALLKALDSVDHLILNLDRVTEIDLSCLQLLCSAHRTAAKMKKQLSLSSGRIEMLRRIIEAAGYSRHVGCVFDCNKNCLWVGGGN